MSIVFVGGFDSKRKSYVVYLVDEGQRTAKALVRVDYVHQYECPWVRLGALLDAAVKLQEWRLCKLSPTDSMV